jgi:hypothetical protein
MDARITKQSIMDMFYRNVVLIYQRTSLLV